AHRLDDIFCGPAANPENATADPFLGRVVEGIDDVEAIAELVEPERKHVGADPRAEWEHVGVAISGERCEVFELREHSLVAVAGDVGGELLRSPEHSRRERT